MAVTLTRTSGKGKFAGHKSNITDYTVQEDSTPLFGDDSSGGAGTLDVPATEVADSVLFVNNDIRLDDTQRGYTTGIARGVSSAAGVLTIKADSRLAKFVAERTAEPVSGTLRDVLEYYFSLVGIDDGYIIDASIGDRIVAYPAWTDNVWTRLKGICVAQQIEISLVSGNIVVRYPRERSAYMGRNSDVNWDITTDLAAYVEVNYYNYEPIINSPVYPLTGDVPSVITLGSEEEAVIELDTNTSLTSIVQPSPTTTALLLISSSENSSYYIVHDGNSEMSGTAWTEAGGMITAEIDPEDNTRIILRLRAPFHPEDGSYRIATRATGDEFANSLRIAGSGIKFNKQVVVTATGANPNLVVDNQSQTIDNPSISTHEQAWTVAHNTATSFAGPKFTIDVASNGIHRAEDITSARYLTADEFNAEYAGMTMAQFNTAHAGTTMDDFNEVYEEQFEDDFENQAFGNVAGARVPYRYNLFRIRTATLTPESIDYTAERDIMATDFNSVYAGLTMDEFNAMWEGMTFDEFSVMPLKRT